MRLLPFWVRLSDGGPRFAQPKPHLSEEPLALSYPQVDAILPFNPTCRCLAVPRFGDAMGENRAVSFAWLSGLRHLDRISAAIA
jgi:hypothetical protein